MASPVYGTQTANYVNLLAGAARGQAEAERLKRMQEQQDLGNVANYLGFTQQADEARARRINQYNWNAYNAATQQQRAQQGYDFDVYDRLFREAQAGRDYDLQTARFGLAQQKAAADYDLAMGRLAVRNAPKPKDVADVYGKLYGGMAFPEEQASARNIAADLGIPVFEGTAPTSRKRGLFDLNPINPFEAGGIQQGILSRITGYDATNLAGEIGDLEQYLTELNQFRQQNAEQGLPFPAELESRQQQAESRLKQLLQTQKDYFPDVRVPTVSEFMDRMPPPLYKRVPGWIGNAWDYYTGD